MPKCPQCGHKYISGELHCPECFEQLPIMATILGEPAATSQRPPVQDQIPESGDQGDPFAGLFNAPQTAPPVVKQQTAATDDIRKLFNPTQPATHHSLPVSGPANAPVQPEPVASPQPVLGTPPKPGAALLRVTHGQGAGVEFGLTQETNMIGRWDPGIKAFVEVDLTAVDGEAKVSRKHARITWAGGKYFIEDLGSANGTYINRGDRLLPGDQVPLQDGDEIIMGKTFLKFILGS